MNGNGNRVAAGRSGPELARDQRIGALLSTLEPAGDVLPWSDVRRLVNSAAPVRVPWYAMVPTRTLRLAFAPLTVLLLIGGLWLMPAQSDQVGTLVLTKLPSAWDYGSPQFTEIAGYARESFTELAIPQSELYIKIGTTGGRPQLAFALLGADEEASRGYFTRLKEKFPALAAFDETYADIGARKYGNLLEQVAGTLADRPGIHELNDDELRLVALKSMTDAGFDDVQISITRDADGTILIEMDAVMRVAVQGHTQEELEAAGFNEQLLGRELYRELLGQLESH